MKRSQVAWLVTSGVLAAALATAAAAWACTPQANVFLDATNVTPGQQVLGHGVGFGPTDVDGVTPVGIRLYSQSGREVELLWSGSSNAVGSFSFSFKVPTVAPAYYIIEAVRPGSPDQPFRAVLHVLAPPATSALHGRPIVSHKRAPTLGPIKVVPLHDVRPPVATSRKSPSGASHRRHLSAPPPVTARAPLTHARSTRPRHARTVVRAPTPPPAPVINPWAAGPVPKVRVGVPTRTGSPWLAALAIGALGLLVLGGAGGLFVGVRHRPRAPDDPLLTLPVARGEVEVAPAAAQEVEPPAPVDVLERELQEMIAMERTIHAGPARDPDLDVDA